MKKGGLAWEYVAALIIAALLLLALIFFSDEIKETILMLIDKIFGLFGGGIS